MATHLIPLRGLQLTLGKRFALSFAAILALLISVTVVSLALMSGISDRMRGIVEVNNHQMALANTMINQLKELGIQVRTVTLLTAVKDIDAQHLAFTATVAAYLDTEKELAQALNANRASPAELELIRKIEAARSKTVPLMAQAAKLGAEGLSMESVGVLMEKVLPVEREWREHVGQLIQLEKDINASAYAAALSTEATARLVLVTVSALAVAIGGVLAWSLTRSVVGPITQAIEVTERIAEGNLSTPVATNRTDELGRMLTAVGRMQGQLRTLVGNIRHSVESISTASTDIASGNRDLSHRTEQQSASLQKTASSMEQLTGTVRHNADSARQADHLATSASAIAARGGQVVDQVVSTMADISANSKKISEIIGVIDGIAFQTNILALNAAVEAARAGEQGRGFAVVAGEVRNLAKRSADAAKEIKSLISTSGERVDSGAKLVDDAGSTMREIVASIERVTTIMSEITSSTSEQSNGIGQVSVEVNQLDQMTQQNAALVEQSASATESLKEQASRLAAAVGVFSLTDRAQPD
ncbi:MAG: methyl-accepting chemotaxis protein [Pseudomonadota bacterium]